ncbi:MAG: hypothetical protein Cons2KO_30080 [Congregibacter sp.]
MPNQRARAIQTKVQIVLQSFFSKLLTLAAHLRLKFINDSGTQIGERSKLFKEIIPPDGIGAELGVYKGTLSQFILVENHPRKLYLIDPWWNYAGDWHWAVGDTSSVRSLASILIVLRKAISERRVEIRIEGSISALSSFNDGYLDWAYVDSTHSYENTVAELNLLKAKTKRGGIIAGDDWNPDPGHPHHGVYRAVKEFIEANDEYLMVYQEGKQWALRITPAS